VEQLREVGAETRATPATHSHHKEHAGYFTSSALNSEYVVAATGSHGNLSQADGMVSQI